MSTLILADRLNAVKPSPTMAVTAKAAQMKADGIDVIGLGAGEPDFDTPLHVRDAAKKAMDEGQTRYTPVGGTKALINAIIGKFKRENQIDYSADEIMVGCGGKQVIFNALLATINPGDEVIIPSPYWVSYPDMTRFAEGLPVVIDCPAEQGFKLTAQSLEAAITKKSKWLILNSPSNPTGAVYTKAELEALIEVIERHPHLLVMSDDIYEHLVYGETKFYTLAQLAPQLKNRILTVNGVSKAYAMTGWRIGYAGGPAAMIKAMTKIQSQSTSNPCSISQAAAVEALNGTQDFLNEWRNAFARRRDLVVAKLNAIEGIDCLTPDGAFYVFPSCKSLLGGKLKTATDFSDYLLEEAKVAVVMGEAFGMDGHFRISYATSDKVLENACERIAKAVAKL